MNSIDFFKDEIDKLSDQIDDSAADIIKASRAISQELDNMDLRGLKQKYIDSISQGLDRIEKDYAEISEYHDSIGLIKVKLQELHENSGEPFSVKDYGVTNKDFVDCQH